MRNLVTYMVCLVAAFTSCHENDVIDLVYNGDKEAIYNDVLGPILLSRYKIVQRISPSDAYEISNDWVSSGWTDKLNDHEDKYINEFLDHWTSYVCDLHPDSDECMKIRRLGRLAESVGESDVMINYIHHNVPVSSGYKTTDWFILYIYTPASQTIEGVSSAVR